MCQIPGAHPSSDRGAIAAAGEKTTPSRISQGTRCLTWIRKRMQMRSDQEEKRKRRKKMTRELTTKCRSSLNTVLYPKAYSLLPKRRIFLGFKLPGASPTCFQLTLHSRENIRSNKLATHDQGPPSAISHSGFVYSTDGAVAVSLFISHLFFIFIGPIATRFFSPLLKFFSFRRSD